MKVAKDWRPLLRAARKQGWRIERGKGYVKCYSPNGADLVVIPSSPGARNRGLQNKVAEFRRAGLRGG